MLATFLIEIFLIVYTLWRYKMTTITRIVVAILGFLALFQMAEYMVCGGLGVSSEGWSRIGFVAITMLPPLGIHLATRIVGKNDRLLVGSAYATALAFGCLFMIAQGIVDRQVCGGNYIIYSVPQNITWLYGVYYYGWLFAGLVYTWQHAQKTKKSTTKKALLGLFAGYVLFMLPTTTVNIIDPTTMQAIPSIMCGFAVLLAFALVYKVIPEVVPQKHRWTWRRIKS